MPWKGKIKWSICLLIAILERLYAEKCLISHVYPCYLPLLPSIFYFSRSFLQEKYGLTFFLSIEERALLLLQAKKKQNCVQRKLFICHHLRFPLIHIVRCGDGLCGRFGCTIFIPEESIQSLFGQTKSVTRVQYSVLPIWSDPLHWRFYSPTISIVRHWPCIFFLVSSFFPSQYTLYFSLVNFFLVLF